MPPKPVPMVANKNVWRTQSMIDEKIDDVAAAADELGVRVVDTLVEETGSDREEFDIDSDECEFPDPDA